MVLFLSILNSLVYPVAVLIFKFSQMFLRCFYFTKPSYLINYRAADLLMPYFRYPLFEMSLVCEQVINAFH